MPGRDGTGPGGTGGRCTPLWMSGQMQRPLGVGFGGGFGRGRGFRNVYNATGLPFWARTGVGVVPVQSPEITKEQEIQMLGNEANLLEQQLNEIKKRINEIKKE